MSDTETKELIEHITKQATEIERQRCVAVCEFFISRSKHQAAVLAMIDCREAIKREGDYA